RICYYAFSDHQQHVYVNAPFNVSMATMSPDGKWVAYQTFESGRWEVYVAPFPATGARWQVSTGGGLFPKWRSDGREIIYTSATGYPAKFFAAPVTLSDVPEIGRPTL